MNSSMLGKNLRITGALLFLCAPSFAQQTSQSFATVDAAFKKSRSQLVASL